MSAPRIGSPVRVRSLSKRVDYIVLSMIDDGHESREGVTSKTDRICVALKM